MRVHLAESCSHGYSPVTPHPGHWGASACFSACLIYSKCNNKDPFLFGCCRHDPVLSPSKPLHIYLPSHIHTYIHTYIHIYIHTYIHTYILFRRAKKTHALNQKSIVLSAPPENIDWNRLSVISS